MTLLPLTLLVPTLGALLVATQGGRPNLREAISLTTAVILFGLVTALYPAVMAAEMPSIILAEPIPGLPIRLAVEPLGLLFATVASGLWIVTTVYAIGYMRGANEQNQTRFFVCFAVAIGAAMGIAFADNLLTLFIFYEVLTLSTWPLVTHKGNAAAKRGGRLYLGILIGTSIGFLLIAIIWTYAATGTLDFRAGGILAGHVEGGALVALLALYMLGIGKAALMPFHRWLPAAMVAPTPVSALLHAVAVVKAGVFSVLKVVVYVFGIDLLADTGASLPLMWVAAFSLIVASLIAMGKDNLKARLAYSTVAQLAYVTLGAMLATDLGIIGGSLQIAMHAMGKITLFFCAGAIYVAAHKTEVSQLDGLGRQMPLTFFAFFIGALSIIGLPPLGGSWAKWYLMLAAIEVQQLAMVAALMISSLLNIAYLMPVVARGFLLPPKGERDGDAPPTAPSPDGLAPAPVAIREAPLACVIPLSLTAAGCVILFFYADAVLALVQLIPLR